MLARLAENMFWLGRYLERAEDTARIIDVTYHAQLEGDPRQEATTYRALLDVLHLSEEYDASHDELTAADVRRFLVLDRDNPGSLLAAVTHARENARSLRELISLEFWQAINDLHLALRSDHWDSGFDERPYELLGLVRDRCLYAIGVSNETMQRDEGWRFLTLGRQIERVEMTSRLIDATFGLDPEPSVDRCVATLRSASALEAYRRVHGSTPQPAKVASFLLFESDFPRSLLWALRSAETMLQKMAGDQRSSAAVRRIGRIRSAIEFREYEELLEGGLSEFLDSVQAAMQDVSSRVASAYFRHLPLGGQHTVSEPTRRLAVSSTGMFAAGDLVTPGGSWAEQGAQQ